MLSEIPATIAISLGSGELGTRTPVAIKVGKRECISRGWLSSCSFQRILRFLTFSLVRVCSSVCQLVRCGLPPSVNQSAACAAVARHNALRKRQLNRRICFGTVLVVFVIAPSAGFAL